MHRREIGVHPRNCVRAGTVGDLSSLIRIDEIAQSSANRRAQLEQALVSGQCFVALENDEVIGFITLSYTFFDCGFIPLLVVAANHRRKGTALRLLRVARKQCRTEKLFSSANRSNFAAARLFAKAGYVESGRIDNLDLEDPEIVFFFGGRVEDRVR